MKRNVLEPWPGTHVLFRLIEKLSHHSVKHGSTVAVKLKNNNFLTPDAELQ